MAHSSFIINYYLIDENNEYILDENGDKIIISTQSVDIDHDYQAIGGQASSRRRYRAVQSFDVKSTEDQTDWHLIINQQTFVGRYPTQAAAISVLYGIMYQHSGNENGFAFALEDMVNRGGSTIDPVGDNIMSQEITGGEFTAKIINFSRDVFVGDATVDFSANEVWLYEDATPLSQQTLVIDAASQEYSIPARYDHSYQSVFKVDKNFVPVFNQNTLTADVIPALSANLSFQSGFPIVGQPLTATATLTNYDSRIPVKYQWTWKQNPSGSNTTVKTETTTSSTSSYTPTSTFNYRVEVEILYALDDSATGVTDSETSGNAQQPFEWLQGPEILNLAQDQYYVFPLVSTDYEATPTPSFNYEWMKNGSAFGTDSASQILDQEGTYTVDVTGQNTINGVPYSETILSRNAIVISPVGADVADIKLFLTNDPTGTVITNPVGGTVYYAYAYDASGVLLTDSGIEWVTPTSSSTAEFGDWLNAANQSVQWSTAAEGTGSFVNQVPITGLNLIEIYDNDGLTKRGMYLTWDAEADKDAFINQTGTLTLAVTVTEAGHVNVGTTYTYSWDFPDGGNYNWSATNSMIKWQWRTAGTLAEDVPAGGSDDLYGDNPTYLLSFT